MENFIDWLAGKKTYLVAFGAALAAGLLLGFGQIDVATATALFAVAGGIAGVGAKVERHSQEALRLVRDLAQSVADAKARPGALYGDGISLVQDGIKLGQALAADDGPAAAGIFTAVTGTSGTVTSITAGGASAK